MFRQDEQDLQDGKSQLHPVDPVHPVHYQSIRTLDFITLLIYFPVGTVNIPLRPPLPSCTHARRRRRVCASGQVCKKAGMGECAGGVVAMPAPDCVNPFDTGGRRILSNIYMG